MSRSPTLTATPIPHAWAAPTPRARRGAGALDWRLATLAGLALLRANARYWPSVAPIVREQLGHWHRRAVAISDPALRELALEKLSEEGFNAEVAATLGTLVPRLHRRPVVKALVALEILYDYLDGLTESPTAQAPEDGRLLFGALTDAVCPMSQRVGDYYREHPHSDTSGYMEELVSTVRFALRGLPGTAKLAELMRQGALRSGEAQLRIHSVSLLGRAQVERWASAHAAGTSLEWREFLAGSASSVLGVHALIVAAADHRTTYAQGLLIERAYLSISALPTVLDSLVDHDSDDAAGRSGFLALYGDREVLQRRLIGVLDDAVQQARDLPNGPHHVMTVVGIVAYYVSAPSATSDFASLTTQRTARHMRPLIGPTLAVLRTWRAAKRLRARHGVRWRSGGRPGR